MLPPRVACAPARPREQHDYTCYMHTCRMSFVVEANCPDRPHKTGKLERRPSRRRPGRRPSSAVSTKPAVLAEADREAALVVAIQLEWR